MRLPYKNEIFYALTGVPDDFRSGWAMVMLQAAIDDSGSDQQGPVYVLSGFIAKAEQWAEFTEEWRTKLKNPPAIDYFKMSEANGLDGQFLGWDIDTRDQKVLALASLIPPRVLYNVECMVDQSAYDSVIKPFLPTIQKSPFMENKRLARLSCYSLSILLLGPNN